MNEETAQWNEHMPCMLEAWVQLQGLCDTVSTARRVSGTEKGVTMITVQYDPDFHTLAHIYLNRFPYFRLHFLILSMWLPCMGWVVFYSREACILSLASMFI